MFVAVNYGKLTKFEAEGSSDSESDVVEANFSIENY